MSENKWHLVASDKDDSTLKCTYQGHLCDKNYAVTIT